MFQTCIDNNAKGRVNSKSAPVIERSSKSITTRLLLICRDTSAHDFRRAFGLVAFE